VGSAPQPQLQGIRGMQYMGAGDLAFANVFTSPRAWVRPPERTRYPLFQVRDAHADFKALGRFEHSVKCACIWLAVSRAPQCGALARFGARPGGSRTAEQRPPARSSKRKNHARLPAITLRGADGDSQAGAATCWPLADECEDPGRRVSYRRTEA
jgi:hypothetical protein